MQRKLSLVERLVANAAARRIMLPGLLAVIWELYALHVDNPLLFPTLLARRWSRYGTRWCTALLLERTWHRRCGSC